MNIRTILFGFVLAGLSGCALKGAKVPGAHIPFAEADYTVMGKTTADTCGTYIFGIDWGHLFTNQGAYRSAPEAVGAFGLPFSLPFLSGASPEERRAMYLALEMIPDATHLLEPRVETTVTGLSPYGVPLFGKRCATVHARGVKIGDKAFSRLND